MYCTDATCQYNISVTLIWGKEVAKRIRFRVNFKKIPVVSLKEVMYIRKRIVTRRSEGQHFYRKRHFNVEIS